MSEFKLKVLGIGGKLISSVDAGNWRDRAAEQYGSLRRQTNKRWLVQLSQGSQVLKSGRGLAHNCDSCEDDFSVDCHDCEQHQQALIAINDIRDRINQLSADGTKYGLSDEDKKDLALLLAVERKYDSMDAA